MMIKFAFLLFFSVICYAENISFKSFDSPSSGFFESYKTTSDVFCTTYDDQVVFIKANETINKSIAMCFKTEGEAIFHRDMILKQKAGNVSGYIFDFIKQNRQKD